MSKHKKITELELKVQRQAAKIYALIQKNKKLKRVIQSKDIEIKDQRLNRIQVENNTSFSRIIKNIGDNNAQEL